MNNSKQKLINRAMEPLDPDNQTNQIPKPRQAGERTPTISQEDPQQLFQTQEESQKANHNLRFSGPAHCSKTGRPYSSDLIEMPPVWGNPPPKHSLQIDHTLTGNRDLFMEKSSDWRYFGESQDNLENRKLLMEKVMLKNELGRMEKILSSQKSQQSKMADNYQNLLEILLQFQQNNSDKNDTMGEFLNKRIEQYLENFSSEMDPDKKDVLMSSLTYISNMSKNISPTDQSSSNKKNQKKILQQSQFEQNSPTSETQTTALEPPHLDTLDKDSLMSALGNGIGLMTSSPTINEKRLFTSETKRHADNLPPNRFIPDYRINTEDNWTASNSHRRAEPVYPIPYQMLPTNINQISDSRHQRPFPKSFDLRSIPAKNQNLNEFPQIRKDKNHSVGQDILKHPLLNEKEWETEEEIKPNSQFHKQYYQTNSMENEEHYHPNSGTDPEVNKNENLSGEQNAFDPDQPALEQDQHTYEPDQYEAESGSMGKSDSRRRSFSDQEEDINLDLEEDDDYGPGYAQSPKLDPKQNDFYREILNQSSKTKHSHHQPRSDLSEPQQPEFLKKFDEHPMDSDSQNYQLRDSTNEDPDMIHLYRDNTQLQTIISEPTVEMRDSAMVMAERRFKRADSRTYFISDREESQHEDETFNHNQFNSIKKQQSKGFLMAVKEDSFYNENDPADENLYQGNEHKFLNSQNHKNWESDRERDPTPHINTGRDMKTMGAEPSRKRSIPSPKSQQEHLTLTNLSHNRNPTSKSKNRPKNLLYESQNSDDDENRRIMENIANNLSSSLQNEPLEKVETESLKNFESFSQKTGGTFQMTGGFDEIDEEDFMRGSFFKKREGQPQNVDLYALMRGKDTDPKPPQTQNQASEDPNSKEQKLKNQKILDNINKSNERLDMPETRPREYEGILPVNRELQESQKGKDLLKLIQMDSEKKSEVNTEPPFKTDFPQKKKQSEIFRNGLLQSSTGGHPLHERDRFLAKKGKNQDENFGFPEEFQNLIRESGSNEDSNGNRKDNSQKTSKRSSANSGDKKKSSQSEDEFDDTELDAQLNPKTDEIYNQNINKIESENDHLNRESTLKRTKGLNLMSNQWSSDDTNSESEILDNQINENKKLPPSQKSSCERIHPAIAKSQKIMFSQTAKNKSTRRSDFMEWGKGMNLLRKNFSNRASIQSLHHKDSQNMKKSLKSALQDLKSSKSGLGLKSKLKRGILKKREGLPHKFRSNNMLKHDSGLKNKNPFLKNRKVSLSNLSTKSLKKKKKDKQKQKLFLTKDWGQTNKGHMMLSLNLPNRDFSKISHNFSKKKIDKQKIEELSQPALMPILSAKVSCGNAELLESIKKEGGFVDSYENQIPKSNLLLESQPKPGGIQENPHKVENLEPKQVQEIQTQNMSQEFNLRNSSKNNQNPETLDTEDEKLKEAENARRKEQFETLSQEDVMLSSMEHTQPNNDKIFDSSLINLQGVDQHILGNFEKKPTPENNTNSKTQEKTIISHFPLKENSEIDENSQFVESQTDITNSKLSSILESNAESKAHQQKKKKKSKKSKIMSLKRAKTPKNSLKDDYKHLKPRRRSKFNISENDWTKFLEREERRRKRKEKTQERQTRVVKKTYKNFFEKEENEKKESVFTEAKDNLENEIVKIGKKSEDTTNKNEDNINPIQVKNLVQNEAMSSDNQKKIQQLSNKKENEIFQGIPKNIFKETKEPESQGETSVNRFSFKKNRSNTLEDENLSNYPNHNHSQVSKQIFNQSPNRESSTRDIELSQQFSAKTTIRGEISSYYYEDMTSQITRTTFNTQNRLPHTLPMKRQDSLASLYPDFTNQHAGHSKEPADFSDEYGYTPDHDDFENDHFSKKNTAAKTGQKFGAQHMERVTSSISLSQQKSRRGHVYNSEKRRIVMRKQPGPEIDISPANPKFQKFISEKVDYPQGIPKSRISQRLEAYKQEIGPIRNTQPTYDEKKIFSQRSKRMKTGSQRNFRKPNKQNFEIELDNYHHDIRPDQTSLKSEPTAQRRQTDPVRFQTRRNNRYFNNPETPYNRPDSPFQPQTDSKFQQSDSDLEYPSHSDSDTEQARRHTDDNYYPNYHPSQHDSNSPFRKKNSQRQKPNHQHPLVQVSGNIDQFYSKNQKQISRINRVPISLSSHLKESEIEVPQADFLRPSAVGSSADFMSGDLGRPIININLGNQPVENLQITSLPNQEENDPKAPMMIHVSYMPKKDDKGRGDIRSRDQLKGMLGIADKQASERRPAQGSPKNLVKSILSKRKRKNKAFDTKWGKQKVLRGNQMDVVYNSYDHTGNEGSSQVWNSDLLNEDELEEMVENEDAEVMKVLNSKQEMYRITFADSEPSQATNYAQSHTSIDDSNRIFNNSFQNSLHPYEPDQPHAELNTHGYTEPFYYDDSRSKNRNPNRNPHTQPNFRNNQNSYYDHSKEHIQDFKKQDNLPTKHYLPQIKQVPVYNQTEEIHDSPRDYFDSTISSYANTPRYMLDSERTPQQHMAPYSRPYPDPRAKPVHTPPRQKVYDARIGIPKNNHPKSPKPQTQNNSKKFKNKKSRSKLKQTKMKRSPSPVLIPRSKSGRMIKIRRKSPLSIKSNAKRYKYVYHNKGLKKVEIRESGQDLVELDNRSEHANYHEETQKSIPDHKQISPPNLSQKSSKKRYKKQKNIRHLRNTRQTPNYQHQDDASEYLDSQPHFSNQPNPNSHYYPNPQLTENSFENINSRQRPVDNYEIEYSKPNPNKQYDGLSHQQKRGHHRFYKERHRQHDNINQNNDDSFQNSFENH